MNTELIREKVMESINNIFKTRFGIYPAYIKEDYVNENLLGGKFRFAPRDLIYLFFEIEKEFNIRISSEAICKGGFRTINKIIDVIIDCRLSQGLAFKENIHE